MIVKCTLCGNVLIGDRTQKAHSCKTRDSHPYVCQGGPGTELSKLIPKMFEAPGCNCKRYAAKMDAWGVEGCEARFERIVKRLVIRSKRKRFIRHFASLNETIIRQLLTKAIDNAKKKEPTSERYSAVWVYWAGGAEGDELRYSMRSAIRNLSDISNVVLCGDKPDWYTGDFIHSPRFDKKQAKRKFGTGRWCKWVDSIVKLKKIIDSPLVTERFLWMYDDTFIVKPSSIDWLSTPRAAGNLPLTSQARSWRVCLHRTATALQNRSLPIRNYSSHFPVVYEKEKLRKTIEEFEAEFRPRAIESLYLNHHFRNPESVSRVFQYNKKISEDWKVNPSAIVVNVGGFKPPVARVIGEMFSEACHVES